MRLNGGQGYVLLDAGYVAIGKGGRNDRTDLYRYLGEIGSGKKMREAAWNARIPRYPLPERRLTFCQVQVLATSLSSTPT